LPTAIQLQQQRLSHDPSLPAESHGPDMSRRLPALHVNKQPGQLNVRIPVAVHHPDPMLTQYPARIGRGLTRYQHHRLVSPAASLVDKVPSSRRIRGAEAEGLGRQCVAHGRGQPEPDRPPTKPTNGLRIAQRLRPGHGLTA